MVTDAERREVARKLREEAAKGPRLAREWDEVLCEALGYRDDEITYVSLVEKLADLIDPDTPGQCPKSCPEMSEIDPAYRKRLLDLAHDLRLLAPMLRSTHSKQGDAVANIYEHISDVIRDCLGCL